MKVVKAKSAKLQGARTYARARVEDPVAHKCLAILSARTYARARAEENTLINTDSLAIKIYAR